MKIEYQPIGFVHSPHETANGTPIQPSRARGIEGTVEPPPQTVENLTEVLQLAARIEAGHLEIHPHQHQGDSIAA